ncbi:MAG: hypothetical protein DME19_10285 [Verrucomicrobia bacterium]|nr:MAG: hypothetical protein DME19_10285 [Verrucomicrobiota bacterium]
MELRTGAIAATVPGQESGLNLWFVDFATAELPVGSVISFTCFWKRDQRWEGRNWQVSVL